MIVVVCDEIAKSEGDSSSIEEAWRMASESDISRSVAYGGSMAGGVIISVIMAGAAIVALAARKAAAYLSWRGIKGGKWRSVIS